MKVVGVIPAGRRQTMECLTHYLERDAHLFDHIQLWENCAGDDLAYIQTLAKSNTLYRLVPSSLDYFVRSVESDVNHRVANIASFYVNCTDPDTLYIKIDDDIVWLEEGALQGLIDFRLANPQYFQVCLATINNSMCNYIFKHIGALPVVPNLCQPKAYCTYCLKQGEVAQKIHNHFLSDLILGNLSRYRFQRWECPERQRTPNHVYAFFGIDYAKFGGVLGSKDEEEWLTQTYTQRTGSLISYYGGHLCSHLSYRWQDEYIRGTDILKRYKEMAK